YSSDVAFRATDLSTDALSLATENAVGHGVADVIGFAPADLTDVADNEPVDVIVANLPYVRTEEVPVLPLAASYEPQVAFDGGDDGLALVRRLLARLAQAFVHDGVALLEIGSDQADALSELVATALPGWTLVIHDDLAAWPRVAQIVRRVG